MKKIVVAIFALSTLSIFAQDDEARVKQIADAISVNCGSPAWGPDSLKAITNYSLYREFKKQGDNQKDDATTIKYYKDAYKGWKYVFVNAPSARETPHLDGITMYKAFADAATTDEAKGAYMDSMLAIYDVRINCFGSTADLEMRKTFAWYSHKNKGNEAYIFHLFENTIESFDTQEGTTKLDMSPAFLAPWMIMAIKAHKTAKIFDEEGVFEVFDVITEIAEYNMTEGNDAGKYKGAYDKCYEYMDKYGYLDPIKIGEIATKKYNENPTDLATQIKVYKILKGAKLYDHPLFTTVAKNVYDQKPSSPMATFLAKKSSEEKDYTSAIKYMQEANEFEGVDSKTKAKNLLNIAQFYQLKGDYSSARSYANKAADMRPGWGKPYLLIGTLYAGSGSKCGSGTGFESQAVVWAAIDMWNKAKSVDPSVATEAQNKINKYWGYMPTTKDLFLRPDISAGDSYRVNCWIGVTTTVRTSD